MHYTLMDCACGLWYGSPPDDCPKRVLDVEIICRRESHRSTHARHHYNHQQQVNVLVINYGVGVHRADHHGDRADHRILGSCS